MSLLIKVRDGGTKTVHREFAVESEHYFRPTMEFIEAQYGPGAEVKFVSDTWYLRWFFRYWWIPIGVYVPDGGGDQ